MPGVDNQNPTAFVVEPSLQPRRVPHNSDEVLARPTVE
jgi:hypothetical protein